jgi:hypothetical protein
MLEMCIQTSYDQNVQLILKSYLPVVYGTTLNATKLSPLKETPHFSLDGLKIFKRGTSALLFFFGLWMFYFQQYFIYIEETRGGVRVMVFNATFNNI